MSCLGLKKKRKKLVDSPSSKKAVNKLISILAKLKRCSKALRSATSHLIKKPERHSHRRNWCSISKQQQPKHNYSSFQPLVHIDELCSQSMAKELEVVSKPVAAEASRSLKAVDKSSVKGNNHNIKRKAKAALFSSSGCYFAAGMSLVDMRAEMFIREFKEEMRLEREESYDEYHQMLARGV